MSRFLDRVGLALLGAAILFQAVSLWPELSIGRLPPNDSIFHLACSERLGQSLGRGEPFLDPWVSEWSLGYPVWQSYQPLPHLLGALVLRLASPVADHPSSFAALQYALLVLLPGSLFLGARLLGLTRLAAGIAACLVMLPSAGGEFGRYGLGVGAYVWRGSGLYTQLVAFHLLPLALGLARRALDRGEGTALASLALALTSLSHIVFGYVAFVSAAVLGVVGPAGEWPARLARLLRVTLLALVLVLWFVVPLFLYGEANKSRWEAEYKWDSFGFLTIRDEIGSGRFFDAGRRPVLSLLMALGLVTVLWRLLVRCPDRAVAARLLALTGTWLALFIGRPTWGLLLKLAGVPAELHLHRLQGPFEMMAVLLTAWGLGELVRLGFARHRALGAIGLLVLASALGYLGRDRLAYLGLNASWGRDNLAAFRREEPELRAALQAVRSILAERPGRVSAGKAATWGREFRVGSLPLYAFLTLEHMDGVSFLYHSMSRTSDVMVLRDESSRVHDYVFGLRAVVAPREHTMPAHLQPRGVFGRFAVYQAAAEGYFGVVNVFARYTGPRSTDYEPASAWLQSPWPGSGMVVALGGGPPELDARLPSFGRWEPFPPPPEGFLPPAGRVLEETKEGEVYRARLAFDRPGFAYVKLTWHPLLEAALDGVRVPLLKVTPGFGAVAVPQGEHRVEVRYRPGPLRPALLLLAAGALVLSTRGFARRRLASGEWWLRARLAGISLFSSPRFRVSLALVVLAILALRPLFRGRLVDGHDAIEYPPRLVELERVLADGVFPPVWAPDLGSGFGQPLFQFAPPLVYWAALPLRLLGLGLANSLQLGLALLHGLGALAMYRLGRRLVRGRLAALGAAAAWLFAPYVSSDLFVRAAFAEASAVAAAPVALLGLVRALDRPGPGRVAAGSLAITLVILGHNGAALLWLPALAAVAFSSALGSGFTRPAAGRLAAGAATLAGGLGLSAWFWLPALAEKHFVKTDLLREGFLHWSSHAATPWQLLWSRWGFGTSVAGPQDGMSFTLGIVHLGFAAAGLVLGLGQAGQRRRTELLVFAFVGAGAAVLATTWSAPVWERLTTLQYLAYPWRALMVPALMLSLLAAPLIDRVSPRVAAVLLGMLVLVNLGHTEPKGYVTFDDEFYLPGEIARKGIATTTREEYAPRWGVTRPAYQEARLTGPGAEVEVLALLSARQEFRVSAATATTLEAATFYYPGWQVEVDGEPVAVEPVAGRGTMSFPVPAGEHRVTLRFGPTPLRSRAWRLSGVCLLVLSLAGLLPVLRRAGRRAHQA